MVVATKCGVTFSDAGEVGANGTRNYIHQSCEGSLKRLGLDYIDLFDLHRTDPDTPVETSVAAIAELIKQGKIRHIGLSEVTTDQIRRAHKIHSINAVQIVNC